METCLNSMTLVQQGAEAKIYKCEFISRPSIVKQRFQKTYRHPELDRKLTQKRLTQEVRSLIRCRKIGIPTPAIFFVDVEQSLLVLEEILDSSTLKDYILNTASSGNGYDTKLNSVMLKLGEDLAKMHDADVIHGDLTTSNLLIKFKDSKRNDFDLYFIDFGLSSSSRQAEDKGVDLYVLEKAFLSTHPNSEMLFNILLDKYKVCSKNSITVLSKYKEIKLRGRKRTMLG